MDQCLQPLLAEFFFIARTQVLHQFVCLARFEAREVVIPVAGCQEVSEHDIEVPGDVVPEHASGNRLPLELHPPADHAGHGEQPPPDILGTKTLASRFRHHCRAERSETFVSLWVMSGAGTKQ